MAFRTDYSKYELVYGRDGKAVELCTGGGSADMAPEDLFELTLADGNRRLAITADRSAGFILGLTLEGDFDVIRHRPQVNIEENCTMVMSRLFKKEYEEGETLNVYLDSGIVYIVIGEAYPHRIRYQTFDPMLQYTFQYDGDMRLRCIQLVLEPDDRTQN